MIFGQLKNLLQGLALPPHLALRVDADAAATLGSATQAVKLILARRQELDRAGQADTPLIVLAGETHINPAHYIHHMLVLKGLLAAGQKVAVGNESPDDLYQLFSVAAGRSPDTEGKDALLRLDPGGSLSVRWRLVMVGKDAGYSCFSFYRFLLRHGVPFRCVDAARDREEKYLDHKDRSSAQHMKLCLGDIAENIPLDSGPGVQIRNHHMAHRTSEFAEETGARIVFLRCGNAHVAGQVDTRDGRLVHEPRHSLSALFRSLHLPFFALLAGRNVPADHGLARQEKFSIGAPGDILAICDPPLPSEMYRAQGLCLVDNAADEKAYVDALARRTGLKEIVVSSGQRKKEEMKAWSGLVTARPKWEDSLPPPR